MADEEMDFEDRYADVPDPAIEDDEQEKKKLELLKLVSTPKVELPPPPPQEEPARLPVPPVAPMPPEPQTFFQKLMFATAPRNLPGAPLAVPPAQPSAAAAPEPSPPLDTPPEPTEAEVQELERLLSREEPLSSDLQPGETGPSKDATLRQAGGTLKSFKGFSPEVDAALVKAAKTYGLDPDVLRGFVAIESAGNPESNRNARTQYKGLFQIGRDEWSKFGKGDIYNAEDNAMAAARLLKDNAIRFEKAMGRPPTAREQYLMHQQGLGFYTKGTMTNIAGNLPASAKGDPNNWTREGFEKFWGNKLDNLIAQAKGSQITGSVPMKELASFMGGEPIAQQKPELTGGLTNTPVAAAQTAALLTGTPIEQIKAIADKINKATVAGAIKNVPGQAPRPVGRERIQTPVEGVLPQGGSVTHTRPMLPIPGMTPRMPVPSFAESQLTNPTVLSTAASFLAQNAPPPSAHAPKAAEDPSFMAKLKPYLDQALADSGIDPADMIENPSPLKDLKVLGNLANNARKALAEKYNIPELTSPDMWTADTAQKMWQMNQDLRGSIKSGMVNLARGSAAGIIQKANVPVGIGTGVLAAGAKLFGSDALKEGAIFGATKAMPFIDQLSRTVAGINPENRGVATDIGEFGGRNITGGPIGTAISAAGEFAAPYLMDYLKKNAPDIPNINPFQVNSATAADLTADKKAAYTIIPAGDGQHVIAETAAGDVLMDDATIKALGYTGIATLGFMAAPGLIKYAYNNIAGPIDPVRELRGVPGSKGMVRSSVFDYWKASTLDQKGPLIDIYQRHYNALQRNNALGANPLTAAAVADQTHIYSNSGVRNFISNVMETGRMRTSTMQFEAKMPDGTPISMRMLHDFAEQTPEFRDFLRLKMQQDELRFNHQKLAEAALKGPKAQAKAAARYKTTIEDISGRTLDVNSISQDIQHIVRSKPEIATAYRAYTSILDEGRRFAQDGRFAKENFNALTEATTKAPNTPIMSASRDVTKLWTQAREGLDPLHILERELGDTLAGRMHNEVIGTYINGLPPDTHFKKVDSEFLRNHTVEPESILKFKQDGVTHTYLADPMVVGMLTLEPAGYRGAMDAMFKASKQGFQLTTTGPLAPYFANTSAFRTWRQHFVTAPVFPKEPGPRTFIQRLSDEVGSRVLGPGFATEYFRSLKEVPRQLTPEIAARWKPAIDQVSNWLKGTRVRDIVGDQNIELMSRILTSETYNNFRHDYEAAGGRSQNWIAQAEERRTYINKAKNISSDPGFKALMDYLERNAQPLSHMWKGDKVMEKAVNEAVDRTAAAWTQGFRNAADSPNMAWAFKNRNRIDPVTGQPITMEKLVAETRRLTGDPSIRGAGRFKVQGDATGDIRLPFQVDNKLQQWGVKGGQAVGSYIVDPFHAAIPWAGVLQNSTTATIAAMANNPFRAATWLMLTQAGPEAAVYAWNRSLGNEYVNYYMEGRSENSRRNWTYIGIPGKKPWEGLEIPDYQEGYLFRHTPVVMLDQMYGRSPFTFREEFDDLWKSFAQNVLVPPLPSPIGATMGYMGAVAPEGLAGELRVPGARSARELNKPDNHIELALRAMFPSIVDFYTQYYHAAHASEGGWPEQVEAGTKAVIHRGVERTPFVRDVLGMKPAAIASSKIVEETYKRRRTIQALEYFYSRDFKNMTGIEDPKGRSKRGMAVVEQNLDPSLIPKGMNQLPGMPQPMPTNPIYTMTMKAMEENFRKDSPQKGGHGYKSMWSLYSSYNKYIDSMRNVSEGNEQAWINKHNNEQINPLEKAKMKEEGIDQKDFRQVKSFYIDQRNKVVKEIFLYMRAAEQQIDQLPEIRKFYGPDKHFTLEDADPYKPGLTPHKE